MSFNEPRRQTEDLLLICEEPQYRASQESTPRAFTPSTMTTTTIVDASITTTHVGCYVIPENGFAKGQIRQITSVSGTTATVDTAWNSTSGVTAIRVWLPADVPVRTTASGSTTTVVSGTGVHASIGNEPDDYWNDKDYHLLGVGGDNAGKASDVTDFATATGTFTVGDTLTSTVAGELFLLRRMLRPETYTISSSRQVLDRDLVGFADANYSVPTTATGTAAIEMPVMPLTATAGDGTQATRPKQLSDMLTSIMTEDRDTGSTVTSASSGADTTTLVVGSGSNFSVGGFVRVNTGEVGQIRAISSNTLTLGPSHITAGNVEASSVAYASAWYKRKDSDFRTMCIDYYRGGLFRHVMHGCLPTVTLTVSRDQIVRLAYNYSAGEAHEYTRTRPVTKGATLPIDILNSSGLMPRDAKAARCLINGTNYLISDLTIDLGFRPALRPSLVGSNQGDGHFMGLAPVSGSFKILADEDDRGVDMIDRLNWGATWDFLFQNGTAPGEIFTACIPYMQVTSAPQSYQDGLGIYDITFRAIKPQLGGPSVAAALPAFAMGFL